MGISFSNVRVKVKAINKGPNSLSKAWEALI